MQGFGWNLIKLYYVVIQGEQSVPWVVETNVSEQP